MTPLPVKLAPAWFRPRSFIAGLVAGLIALSWLGWSVSRLNYHRQFTRFHPEIAPEGSYYPTIAELCSIVRARCRPDQVLVIVGGNSIFYGVGQPAADMWTNRLQELLGDRYAVVNLAFRGAAADDGGALAAEVLRQEFPRQIYVANVGMMTCLDPSGSDPYRFMFWEAYFKGLLLPHPARSEWVRQRYAYSWTRIAPMVDVVGKVELDRALHFDDLWNYVSFDWINTVPSFYHPDFPGVFTPRDAYADTEPDFRSIPFDERYQPAALPVEMEIVRGATIPYYHRAAGGSWELDPRTRHDFEMMDRAAMPAPLRRRTLIVVSQNSPYYVDRLKPDERARDDAGYADSMAIWREAGYQAMTYPAGFTIDDYGDRTHLTVPGGHKLAVSVAAQVRSLAAGLGYGSAAPPKP